MGAFVGLEDIDEPADQVPEAAVGLFARLAQHGLEARERFSIGLKFGLYDGRKRKVAPAASIFSRTAVRLWLNRLSVMTTSPGRSSGTGTWAT
jgi:hypothetical protein